MIKVLGILLLLVGATLGFGIGTPQRNSEELFLSDAARETFKSEQLRFGVQDPVIVTGMTQETNDTISFKVDELGGEFMRLHPKKFSQALIALPTMEDAAKFKFFEKLHGLDASLAFAGGPYTNAELAGMSLKIQDQLFPVLFAVVFILCWFFLRDFKTALYLFLSSLLGAGVGLTLVRLIYGTSTILTTLTPLVGFVLTLGVQLHVVYGLAVSTKLSDFWQEKLRPLSIMMVTTLVGFFSLISSDLMAVRQLAITAGTTLLITWLINLVLLKSGLVQVKPHWHKITEPMQHMRAKSWLGWAIIFSLSLAGIIGLKKMPVLVEALYFFPQDHRIQVGARAVSEITGGTPQFEVLIQRKDGAAWSYADTQAMEAVEVPAFPARLISAGQIVRTINQEYAGSSSLPEVEIAFRMLLGKAPPMLGSALITEHGYKWIILAHPQRSSERAALEQALEERLKTLPAPYTAQIGGMTYWLLKSQGQLITSLLKSFLISLVVIVVTFALFERRLKAIIAFVAINVASILGGFAVMAISGFELNVSSVMTASIALGLVVDSTIHLMFMSREGQWVKATYHPIVLSHLVLFVSFALLTIEPFIPIRDFALGLIFLLGVGLACDLWVLPLIDSKVE